MKQVDIELGWLAPNGDFYPAAWGEHETVGGNIITKFHWFEEWSDGEIILFRDFLCLKKNFVLIDNPSMTEIKVTTGKYLTRQQKQYLYEMYRSIGIIKSDLYEE